MKQTKNRNYTIRILLATVALMVASQVLFAQPPPPPPPPSPPSGVPIDGGILALIGGLGAYVLRKYVKKK